MKQLFVVIIIGVISFLPHFGCNGIIGPGMPREFTINQFPNNPGTQWTYAIVDSGPTIQYDTVTVTIVGFDRLPPRIVPTLWQLRYRNHTDTVRVGFEHDTMSIEASGWPGTRTLYFPLEDGKRWGYNYGLGGDSVAITHSQTATPAGYFPDAYFVREHAFQVGPVAHLFAETWLVPGVGIVHITSRASEFLTQKTEWVLVGYYVP